MNKKIDSSGKESNLQNFSDKNLLILTHGYPDINNKIVLCPFVKNQVNALGKYFNKIYVIVPTPILYTSYRWTIQCWKYAKDYEIGNIIIKYVYYPFPRDFEQISFIRPTIYKYIKKAIEKIIFRYNISFDIIHVHFTQPIGYVAMQLSRKYHVPYLITIHEQGFSLSQELSSNRADIYESWANADALIRVNKSDLVLLKKYNNNCYYVPNGYPEKYPSLSTTASRSKLGIPDDQTVLFTLGTLSGTRKGHQDAINAVSSLIPQYPNLHYYIGGYGTQRWVRKLKKQISALSAESNVHILGELPSEKIPLWYCACDSFVLASHAEGNPTVMFEALGCGRPYVGTAVGGVEDIICDSKYGYLCRPQKPEELKSIIQMALRTHWNYDEILEYGKRYSWEKVMEREVLPIYQKILSN